MIFNSGNATNTARDGNILAYYPLKKQLVLGLGWSDIASNVTGYILGLVWAFALHRRVTFAPTRRSDSAFVRFVIVCVWRTPRTWSSCCLQKLARPRQLRAPRSRERGLQRLRLSSLPVVRVPTLTGDPSARAPPWRLRSHRRGGRVKSSPRRSPCN